MRLEPILLMTRVQLHPEIPAMELLEEILFRMGFVPAGELITVIRADMFVLIVLVIMRVLAERVMIQPLREFVIEL